MFVLLPSQTGVEEEEEDEEKPSPTTPEKEPEQSADPPQPTNPENNLFSTEVKRSACLLGFFFPQIQFYLMIDLFDHLEAAHKV